MNKQEEYAQAAMGEHQKIILFAEKYIVRRALPPTPEAEDAIVQSTRDCMVQVLNTVRAQYCILGLPPEVCVGILYRSNADLLFGLELNPFWRQYKTALVGPLQMTVNSAYDAVAEDRYGDMAMVRAFAGTCGDLAAMIVMLHAGWPHLRTVSRQLKRDIAAIYG